jgi:hypothetical protein
LRPKNRIVSVERQHVSRTEPRGPTQEVTPLDASKQLHHNNKGGRVSEGADISNDRFGSRLCENAELIWLFSILIKSSPKKSAQNRTTAGFFGAFHPTEQVVDGFHTASTDGGPSVLLSSDNRVYWTLRYDPEVDREMSAISLEPNPFG